MFELGLAWQTKGSDCSVPGLVVAAANGRWMLPASTCPVREVEVVATSEQWNPSVGIELAVTSEEKRSRIITES
jgi:hypothetical protein